MKAVERSLRTVDCPELLRNSDRHHLVLYTIPRSSMGDYDIEGLNEVFRLRC